MQNLICAGGCHRMPYCRELGLEAACLYHRLVIRSALSCVLLQLVKHVCHAGINSIMEACHSAVPIVAIPLIAGDTLMPVQAAAAQSIVAATFC